MATIPRYYGFYRAKVTEANPPGYTQYGAVRIFIPDFQIESIDPDFNDEEGGLLAYPANSPVGGLNPDDRTQESFFHGSYYIPQTGSFVWVFFERGDPNRPFYFASMNAQINEIPKEHTLTTEPHKVVTVIKTHSGRAIVVSDASGAERVELTGKKRLLDGVTVPEGDESSTYEITDNQTTIWLDERSAQEKLLIMSHKGDYINFDIQGRKLNIEFNGDINIKSGGKISVEAEGDIHTHSGGDTIISADGSVELRSGGAACITADGASHFNSRGEMRLDSNVDVKAEKGVRRRARWSSPDSPDEGNTNR